MTGKVNKVGYRLLTIWIEAYKNDKSDTRYNYISLRPTQSLLQKWLREVHKLHVNIIMYEYWYPEVEIINDRAESYPHPNYEYPNGKVDYETYEEALEIGLQEALKLIKENC